MNFPIIKNNPLCLAISFGATIGAFFFSTFGSNYYQAGILMFGIGITSFVYTEKFSASGDEAEPSGRKFQNIAVLGISGLLTFLFLNIFIPELSFLNGNVTLTTPFVQTVFTVGAVYSAAWTTSFIFNVFIVPPNEEQFFRVMIGNILSKASRGNRLIFVVQIPLVGALPVILMFLVGTVFATFHIAVYSLNLTTLTILWGAGSMLYYFDLRAGNPIPSILAHMLNNALAFLYQGNILVMTFPSIAQLQPPAATLFYPILQMLPVLGMVLYVKYVRHRPLWGLT